VDALQKLAEGLDAQRRSLGDDDAVQEGFLRVVTGRDPIGLANPPGYWYSASRNALHDRRRREAAESRAVRAWLDLRPPATEPERWSEDQIGGLRTAIERLEGRRRRLVDLELGGVRRVGDLAEALGITEGAARVLRHRTYRQLRAILSAGGTAA
jgi:RNA polymerase sigma factor (sigma-70 family)